MIKRLASCRYTLGLARSSNLPRTPLHTSTVDTRTDSWSVPRSSASSDKVTTQRLQGQIPSGPTPNHIVDTDQDFYTFNGSTEERSHHYNEAIERAQEESSPDRRTWYFAIRGCLARGDRERLNDIYRKMLNSNQCLDLDDNAAFSLWERCLRFGRNDLNLCRNLIKHAAARLESRKRPRVYSIVMRMIVAHAIPLPNIEAMHRDLLLYGMQPDPLHTKELVQEVFSSKKIETLLPNFLRQFKEFEVETELFYATMMRLCSSARYETASSLLAQLLTDKKTVRNEQMLAGILSYHVRHSSRKAGRQFISMVLATGISIHLTLAVEIARFYGMELELQALKQIMVSHMSCTDEEKTRIWSAATRHALRAGKSMSRTLQALRGIAVADDPDILQTCLEEASSIEETFIVFKAIKEKDSPLSKRGHAVIVRYLAKAGDVAQAMEILESVQGNTPRSFEQLKDAQFLRRCLMLGLLERGDFSQVEAVHETWVAQKLDNVDTWNLLIRSRLQEGRLNKALVALKQVASKRFPIENATAREFVLIILRSRQPGKAPDVMDLQDRRPYLVDIKEAVAVLRKCLELGGRVQPETWREVLKRLGLYGEFGTLGVLTDWLIPQYALDDGLPATKQLFVPADDVSQLPKSHEHHPLRRLIREEDVAATITRGFKNDKAVEALELVRKWISMGVTCNADLIQERILVGLEHERRSVNFENEPERLTFSRLYNKVSELRSKLREELEAYTPMPSSYQ